MKLVRLEKESAEYERVREDLRTASAKVAELDKTNKKLYAQAHADKKTIIKLNEVSYSMWCSGVMFTYVCTYIYTHVCTYIMH